VAVADIYIITSKDKSYFINGKPPSAVFIKNTWEITGLDNELIEKRKQLAELDAELDYTQTKLNAYRTMIDVWRTLSANERSSF
jgi:hypothetical protein